MASRVRPSVARAANIAFLAATMLGPDLASAGVELPAPGTPTWTASVGEDTEIVDVVLSPDGSTFYAAGSRRDSRQAAMLSAYDAATGDLRWQFTSSRSSLGTGVAIAPNGNRVVLVGNVAIRGRSGRALGTWAFRASDGASLWSARHVGNGEHRGDIANDVAFAPGGGRVFVAGMAWYEGRRRDAVVLAYSAARGTRQWIRVSDSGRSGGAGMSDFANALTVSADGRTVIATGMSHWSPKRFGGRLLTFAMSSVTGRLRWLSRIRMPSRRDDIEHVGLDLDVLGGSVVVAGSSRYLEPGMPAYLSLTVRLRLSDGRLKWWRRFRTDDMGVTLAKSMEARPDGIFVGGWNAVSSVGARFRIWSHAPSGGQVRWASSDLGGGEVEHVTLGSDSNLVYAGGWLNPEGGMMELTVVAYEPETGAIAWYADAGPNSGAVTGLAVTDDGSMLFAAGRSTDGASVVAFTAPS